MKITPTTLPDVLLIEPDVHRDDRGFFLETWRSGCAPMTTMGQTGLDDRLLLSDRSEHLLAFALRERDAGELLRSPFHWAALSLFPIPPT